MQEPATKRAVAFFDGQNLYHHAKAAFGHNHPNYDPVKLLANVCEHLGFKPIGTRFYTGLPSAAHDPMWNAYWSNRLLALSRAGVLAISRPLRYYTQAVAVAGGSTEDVVTPVEKGIDVRIALDVIRLTRGNQLDVVILFSQDQDLAEVVADVRDIARSQNRWVKVVSAFPDSPTASAHRGIANTDWFRMDRAFYDRCLDPRDYRPRAPSTR
jgi:uncharacterized LabA/DUF88 family protein